jgi:hypothetical protein
VSPSTSWSSISGAEGLATLLVIAESAHAETDGLPMWGTLTLHSPNRPP